MASFHTINKAPGVYIQEITLPGPIAGASTSIAAFVGPAQMGPLLTPTPLTSVKQFWEIFGTYIETPYRSYAAHAVNGFFAEGGQLCYFVRVGNGVPAWLNLKDQGNLVSGNPQQKTLVVTAQQEGTAGDSIKVEVDLPSPGLASTTVVNPSPLTVAAITAQSPVATISSTTALNAGVVVDTNKGFAPGDLVYLSDGTNSDNATIATITPVPSTTKFTFNFASPLANSYSSGNAIKRDRITVSSATAAANFLPGDVVTLKDATTENATIASISGATIVFQSPLANNYTAGPGTIALANLAVGATTVRVASTIGLEPGSYITITNGTKTDYNVVNLVNSVNNVLTLASGLTNPYPMGSGAATVNVTSMEFTLKVTGIPVAETYPNLAMDSRHSRYFGNIVNSGFINIALANPPSTTPPPLNMPAAIAASPLSGGVDDDLAHVTTAHYHAGIDALKKFSDVNLLCVPDAVTTAPSGNSHFQIADTHDIQSYMVAHCESMQDRFAILDPSQFNSFDFTYNAIQSQRQGLNSNNGYGALYFPWIAISSPFGSGQILVPPSGHVAGVYSKNDNNFGVFKAPANEPILAALALDANLSDDEQGPLNSAGINVIRSFPGGGITIWGARTITPAALVPWRFVNVRRLLLFIEKSIQEGTRFAVFEPNNQTLWGQLKRIVDDFLTTQWQEGALFGDTAAKAFRVVVDETNNPPSIRAQGILIVEVTVVPTTPAEFIVFRVIQDITGASLQESTS